MRVAFSKMHGAGNDFVVVNCLEGDPVEDWSRFARFALDRHLGIGGDQLLLVQPSHDADFTMGIRNVDGSTAEMCANGIRAFLKYVYDKGLTNQRAISVETLAGIVKPRFVENDLIEIEMTVPVLEPTKIPTNLQGDIPLREVKLEALGQEYLVTPVSMGNPHCVIFMDEIENIRMHDLGPAIENHPAFPARTNVEFVTVRSRNELTQRTWERGTGETLACGSGACAVGVAAILTGHTDREVQIELRGGILEVRWPTNDSTVWLRGPATHVFGAEIEFK